MINRSIYKQWPAALLTFTLLWLNGCTVRKVSQVEPSKAAPAPRESIVGVTTKSGEAVSFDPPGGTITQNTITAKVKKVPYSVPAQDVQRVWIERRETSTARTIGLVAAIAVASLALIVGIAAAAKQSCPFVYSWDGTRYVFDAEPYGGAITRGLERDDFSELEHLREQDGAYRLLLTNEVDETQYTNLMELWVADHAPGTRIVADEAGKLYGLSGIQKLSSARDRYGNNLLPWLESTDRRIWEPDAVAGPDGSLRQEVLLTFPKPDGATQAHLVANAVTGMWGSYMIKKTVELRGRDAQTWLTSLDKNPADAMAVHAWAAREETYRLRIEVEEPTGWELRGTLLGGGPLLAEDRVIPLDVSRVPGPQVRIRMRPPVGFWAFNSFAIAYGVASPVKVTRISAASAQTTGGKDVLPELSAVDDRYYAMPDNIDRAELRFPAPPRAAGLERTVFLHSRGWYQLHLNASGEPDAAKLQQIMAEREGAVKFAVREFAAWQPAHK